jgi:hypothetical protein
VKCLSSAKNDRARGAGLESGGRDAVVSSYALKSVCTPRKRTWTLASSQAHHNDQSSSPQLSTRTMSFYFAIIGTKDNPLFEHEFGTSKQGGDGIARFREEQRHMNQFIVHSSLDIVEEVQWGTGSM